ncbi:LCP family protein [Clostridium carnis]
MSEENKEKKPKKFFTTKNIVIGCIVFILFIVIGSAAIGYFCFNKVISKVETIEIEKEPEKLGIAEEVAEKHKEVKNIALFGIDAEDGEVGRSDAIMVLTLDSVHNKMKLTSIMRDSYVYIPDMYMDKINHAHAFGGPELAIRTINENFNLNIQDFMSVSFTSLPIIIDEIGGVEVNITDEEVKHIEGISSPGLYNLTGAQALDYSRIRYATGGDYKRTERQRVIIEGVFNKLKNTSISNYNSLINKFLPYVKTNMSSMELLELSIDFADLIPSGLELDRFPKDEQCAGQLINGIYYLTFDRENVKNSIYEYIFNDN